MSTIRRANNQIAGLERGSFFGAWWGGCNIAKKVILVILAIGFSHSLLILTPEIHSIHLGIIALVLARCYIDVSIKLLKNTITSFKI